MSKRSVRDQRVKDVLTRVEQILLNSLTESAAKEAIEDIDSTLTIVVGSGTGRNNPIVSMLTHTGNYWCGAITMALRAGTLRTSTIMGVINAILTDSNISARMLTLHLRDLERDGLVERVIYPGHSRVEYRLTQTGRDLSDFVVKIVAWGARNAENVTAAREAFDARYK